MSIIDDLRTQLAGTEQALGQLRVQLAEVTRERDYWQGAYRLEAEISKGWKASLSRVRAALEPSEESIALVRESLDDGIEPVDRAIAREIAKDILRDLRRTAGLETTTKPGETP